MVIVIGAEKGGVGKTKIATNLAALAASYGVDVVLLDTDRQGSSVSWGNIRKEDESLSRVPVLPLPPNPARELASLAGKYSLVIVDIGAQNYRTMMECALLSDIVLVPCGADQQEIESTLSVFDALKTKGDKHEYGYMPAHVVLNRVSHLKNSKSTEQLRTLFAAEGISVFDAHIASRAAWAATGKTGRGLHELQSADNSDKATEEMQAVYNEILKRVTKKGYSNG